MARTGKSVICSRAEFPVNLHRNVIGVRLGMRNGTVNGRSRLRYCLFNTSISLHLLTWPPGSPQLSTRRDDASTSVQYAQLPMHAYNLEWWTGRASDALNVLALGSLRGLTPEWFCGSALRLNPRAGTSRHYWRPKGAKSRILRVQALVNEACQAGRHPWHLHIFTRVIIFMESTSLITRGFESQITLYRHGRALVLKVFVSPPEGDCLSDVCHGIRC